MTYQISDAHHPAQICFNGHYRKWLQDFNRCPRVLEHLSHMTDDIQLLPTNLQSSYCHINIGYVDTDSVAFYHRHSVPYLVILLPCHMNETISEQLQIIERHPEEAFHLIEQYEGKVPKEFI